MTAVSGLPPPADGGLTSLRATHLRQVSAVGLNPLLRSEALYPHPFNRIGRVLRKWPDDWRQLAEGAAGAGGPPSEAHPT